MKATLTGFVATAALALAGCRSFAAIDAGGTPDRRGSAAGAPGGTDGGESGRAAIDAALDRIYPSERDYPFALKPSPGETEAALAEVVAYRASKPVPHWHYVTYGLSELGEKRSSDPKLSGFGIEYTLRLVDDSAQPPFWPINLLRWIARTVRETRAPYDPGHSMNLPAGMLDSVSPGIEGLAFFEDEQLGSLDTPNGRVVFVTVTPLMAGEWALMGSWDAYKVAAEIRGLQKDLLWRPGRQSVLDGPRGDAIRAMVEKDGSSQGLDFAEMTFDAKELVLDDVGRTVFDKFLRHRLAYGRDAKVVAGERVVDLAPGPWQFRVDKDSCRVQVPAAEAQALADELTKAADKAVVVRAGGVRFRMALSAP